MAPAPCWPTKAIAPDSGNVLPILMVVSVKPWPFDAVFFGIAAPGSPGVGAAPPGALGAGAAPAAEDWAGRLLSAFLAFEPPGAGPG